jgi:hypothetical protein
MNSEASGDTGGYFDIEVFDRLVRVRAGGEWGASITSEFIKEFKEEVTALGSGDWGVYFDLRGWEFADPQAREYLEELGEWTAPQGSGDHIFLLNGDSIQEALISRILSVSSHESRFFTDARECRKWLDASIAGHTDYDVVLEPLEAVEENPL